jgi:hypothetical protein
MTVAMPSLLARSRAELLAFQAGLRKEFDAFKARGLDLDMTRGKPAPEQFDLSNELLRLPDNADWHADVFIARAERRAADDVAGAHRLDTVAMRHLAALFEPPTADEGMPIVLVRETHD